MYNVLVVDDEINILEGIVTMVDWERCHTNVSGKAYHGKMAFEFIHREQPDIVITDIKMPGLSGVELIEKVHAIYPHIRFIVLSGYDEFEFAKTVMKHGVQHYLLKPSNELKIEEALKQTVADLDMQNSKENLIEEIRSTLNQVVHKAKEQLLREFIINQDYSKKEWEYHRELVGIHTSSELFRLVGFKIAEYYDYSQLSALKTALDNRFKDNPHILLSTIISERILFLADENGIPSLIEDVKQVKEEWESLYGNTFITAISSKTSIGNLHDDYKCIVNVPQTCFSPENWNIVKCENQLSSDRIKNKLITEVIHYADQHLHNESLSLSYLAKNIFFMNSDYLGKLFKKETGEKFSLYLKKARMMRAIELIEHSEEVKISEVAEEIGLGNNPQYFSQLFKQYTGCSPTGYKRAHLNRGLQM